MEWFFEKVYNLHKSHWRDMENTHSKIKQHKEIKRKGYNQAIYDVCKLINDHEGLMTHEQLVSLFKKPKI